MKGNRIMQQLFVNTASNSVGQQGYVPFDPNGRKLVSGRDQERYFLTELDCPIEAQALIEAIQPVLCWQVITVPGRKALVAANAVVTRELKTLLRLGCDVGTEHRFFPGRKPSMFSVVYTTTDYFEATGVAAELNGELEGELST